MQKPKKPLVALRPEERIVGAGGKREHLNPKSRSFETPVKKSAPKPTKKKPEDEDFTKLLMP